MARIILIMLFTFLTVSCSDLFSTRDPENPDNDETYSWKTIPELLQNFETALINGDINRYESVFCSGMSGDYTYRFVSEATDISIPAVFNDWDLDNERAFITGIKDSGCGFISVELDNAPYDETADSLALDIDYSIVLACPEDTLTVRGSFIFELIKQEGYSWCIWKWTDFSFEDYPSFSKLKEPYAF